MSDSRYTVIPHYLLTFFAGMVELGVPILLLYHNTPIWLIGLFASLYHLGYVIKDSLKLDDKNWHTPFPMVLLAPSLLLLASSMILGNMWLLGVSLLSSNTLIQTVRSLYKNSVRINSSVKNISRILGFAAAGITTLYSFTIAILAIAICFLVSTFPPTVGKVNKSGNRSRGQESEPSEAKYLLLFEFLHHTHYFMYCYFLIYLLSVKFNSSLELAGILFVIGWIGYGIDAALIHTFRLSYPVLGHIVSSVSIVLIAVADKLEYTLLLWFLTGVGGGTAFVLDFATSLKLKRSRREVYENLGHVIGPLMAVLVILLSNIEHVFVVAGLICCLAAFVIALPKIIYSFS